MLIDIASQALLLSRLSIHLSPTLHFPLTLNESLTLGESICASGYAVATPKRKKHIKNFLDPYQEFSFENAWKWQLKVGQKRIFHCNKSEFHCFK